MKLKDVVVVRDGEPVAGTWLIAKGFGRKHQIVVELIEKYKKNFEDLGRLEAHKHLSTGGRPVVEYLLCKTQCMLLAGFIRTSKAKTQFLSSLIKSFEKTDKTLKEIIQALDAFDVDDINVRYIYAAQDSRGRLKIGISNNPERRLKNLNIGNADELKLIYTKEATSCGYRDEVELHKKASGYCIKNEWFEPEAIRFLQ